MDTEDGEFVIAGTGGSDEELLFDEVVGHIEDFMITFDAARLLATLPAFHHISGDHERYAVYRDFLAKVEAELDKYVMLHCSRPLNVSDMTELLRRHQDEITDEVWDFVSDGCMDYDAFLTCWSSTADETMM